MWSVLSFAWSLMSETLKRFLNMFRHGEVYLLLFVVPIEDDSNVFSSSPVVFDSVFAYLDCSNEMIGVFFACVFDPKD